MTAPAKGFAHVIDADLDLVPCLISIDCATASSPIGP